MTTEIKIYLLVILISMPFWLPKILRLLDSALDTLKFNLESRGVEFRELSKEEDKKVENHAVVFFGALIAGWFTSIGWIVISLF